MLNILQFDYYLQGPSFLWFHGVLLQGPSIFMWWRSSDDKFRFSALKTAGIHKKKIAGLWFPLCIIIAQLLKYYASDNVKTTLNFKGAKRYILSRRLTLIQSLRVINTNRN